MITLDVADLVVIAGQVSGTGTDAALGEIDVAAAQSALAEAGLDGRVLTSRDTAAAAGIRLVHALLRHRPFARHGEQIALMAGLQFLSLNGWRADLCPPDVAAVVVGALASGQLNPASAATWLAPRLAPGPRPATRIQVPVRYPQVLLFVQAGCWALGAAGGLALYATAPAHGMPWPSDAFPFAWAALTGGLATVKFKLGRRLERHRSKGTWQAVIATELAMTCFGVLWLLIPAYGFIMFGLSGAVLSLAAVLCMIRPRTRQYFTGPDTPGSPDADPSPGQAGCWRLTPAGQRPAVASP